MPSTYTVNLGIEKPATGEQSGTWGDTTNVNFDIIDQAVNGSERVTLTSAGTSGSPNDLNIVNGSTTSSEGRNKWLEIYSASDLGGSAYVRLVPNDAEKILFIRNSLAGSQSVLLFQGTYNASNDLEIPAGVDMVVKFDGAGASATVTDVFTKLRATEITTPTLTAGTADINGGSVDGATVGAASASTGAFTTLTASTSLNIASSTTVDGVLDEDNMASDSATKLATQQSIKAYVDSQVGAVDTLAEILANGNTSGANNLIIDNGQALTSNTINETTAGSGVTIDSVLLKDDGVNATNLEITNIKANDGTAAATIANSTGNFTITNFISNSVDIGGGAIDGTVIGGSTAAAGTFTTGQFNTSLNVDGTTNLDVVDIDGAVDMASTLTVGGTTNDGTSLVQIAQSGTGRAFSVNRNVASATRAVVNIAQLQASGGAEAVLDIQQTASASRAIKVTPDGSIDRFSVYGTGALVTTPVAGGHAVFNEGGADADFRVESATTANALFVEGSSGNVGIGTSSPDTLLHLSDTAGGAVIRLERNDTSIVSTDVYGEIQFEGQDSSAGSAAGIRGKILGVAEGVTGEMALAFQTAGSYGSSTERARLDSSGNLLVGKTALDNSTVGIRMNATGDASFVSDGARPLVLNRKTSDGDIALFLKDGTTVGSIGTIAGYMTAGTSDTGVLFHSGEDNIQPWNVSTNAGRDAAIDLGVAGARFKDLYLSGGVYLGGTGAANHLDDYEEGTWNPEIYYQNATDQGNATNTTQTGYYTKIGRVVTLDFRLIWNITGSPANDNIGVKNLPFTGGGDTFAAAGVAYPVNNSTTIPTLLLTRPVNGGTTALCQDGEMSSNLGNEFGSGNAKEIRGTVTYFTDA